MKVRKPGHFKTISTGKRFRETVLELKILAAALRKEHAEKKKESN